MRKNSTLSNPIASPKSDNFTAHLGRGEDVLDCVVKITDGDYHTLKDICGDNGAASELVLVDKIYLEALLAQSKNQRLREAVSKQTKIPLEKQNIPKFEVNDIVKTDKSEMTYII